MKATLSQRITRIAALICLAPLLGFAIFCSMVGEALELVGGTLTRWCNAMLTSTGAPKVRRGTERRTAGKGRIARIK